MRIILIIISGLFFIACNNKKNNHSIGGDAITIEYLNENILNNNIKDIKSKFPKDYFLKDTLISSNEDESLKWNGVIVLKGEKEVCLLESNWLNKEKISRITVYSDEVKYTGNLSVGVSLKSIETYVDKKSLNESPDGYLFLKDKKNSNIIYSVENNTLNEIRKYSDINQDFKIDEIIISSLPR